MNYQETSRQAFISFSEVSGFLDRAILETLQDFPEGLTCQDIEKHIKRSHQAVSGNLRHLVEKGYVIPSGNFGLTESGRKAIVWVLKKA
jgi:Mn-dependent DtxR family transcriptional regulator